MVPKTICNNDCVKMFIDIIIAITPYIVLIFTDKNSKKILDIQLSETKKNFEMQLKANRENYESQLLESRETTRLSILPYLFLIKSCIKFSFRKNYKDIVDIDLTFINKGNGTATNIMCKYLKDINNKFSNVIAQTLSYKYYVAIPFDWHSNISMVKEKTKMKIMFEPSKVLFDTTDIILSDQFKFKILFKDIQGRRYEQEFFIQFCVEGNEYKPLLVESFEPQNIY